MIEELTPRRFAYLRLRDGLQNVPSFNYVATPEALEAEAKVMDAIKEYENGAPLSVVRDAFHVWKEIQIEQAKPRLLFDGM